MSRIGARIQNPVLTCKSSSLSAFCLLVLQSEILETEMMFDNTHYTWSQVAQMYVIFSYVCILSGSSTIIGCNLQCGPNLSLKVDVLVWDIFLLCLPHLAWYIVSLGNWQAQQTSTKQKSPKEKYTEKTSTAAIRVLQYKCRCTLPRLTRLLETHDHWPRWLQCPILI